MQVIGLCRFSYPAIGGFQVEHDTIDERIAFLYAQERLEERFRLFETIALPCLKEQTDQDFDLIMVVGESLPTHYLTRLRDLCSEVPQIRIQAEPPRKQRQIMRRILNDARQDPNAPCLQFRHDDDDAVSVDFIERLRQTVSDCSGLVSRNQTTAIDFSRGYIAELGKDGISATEVHRNCTVAALGMHIAGGCMTSIMNFTHHKIPKLMPTISLSDAPMYVRTHNQFNDSRQKAVKTFQTEPLTPEQIGEFEARFAIKNDHVRKLFSEGGS